MIPAMTTGMTDFIIYSGLSTADAEIPTPALAVPYEAPNAFHLKTKNNQNYFN
jgi:hypothetical protein